MMLYGRGLDQARVSSTSGTGGLSQYQEQLEFEDEPVTYRAPRSRLSRSIGLVLFLLVLGGAAFGGDLPVFEPGTPAAARSEAVFRQAAVEA